MTQDRTEAPIFSLRDVLEIVDTMDANLNMPTARGLKKTFAQAAAMKWGKGPQEENGADADGAEQ